MPKCSWITSSGKKCSNNILMDNFCSRHLKQKCSICLEQVRSLNSAQTKKLKCGHAFHMECILNWFKNSDACPTCRSSQHNDPLIKFKTSVEDEIREKYLEVNKSLEQEIRKLLDTIHRQRAYINHLEYANSR